MAVICPPAGHAFGDDDEGAGAAQAAVATPRMASAGFAFKHMPPSGQGMPGGSNPQPPVESTLLFWREVEDLVKHREQLRHSNKWKQADMLRDQLRSMGVQIDDKNNTWSCSDGSSGAIPSWSDATSVPPADAQPLLPPGPPPADVYPQVCTHVRRHAYMHV